MPQYGSEIISIFTLDILDTLSSPPPPRFQSVYMGELTIRVFKRLID